MFYFCSRIFLTKMQNNMIIEQTEDGIPTLYLPRMDEHYHSTKGALAEARHVYIDSALRASGKKEINVLEIGFGTGLNTFLTFLESQEKGLRINYTTFELYPLSPDITEKLNYPALIAQAQNRYLLFYINANGIKRSLYHPCLPYTNAMPTSPEPLSKEYTTWFISMRSLPKSNPKCGTRKFSGRFSVTCLRVVF